MAKIKAVYGAYKTIEEASCMRWLFSGVRTDGAFAAWSLTYCFITRKFSVRNIKREQAIKYAAAMGQKSLFGSAPDEPVTYKGSVTSILRSQLKPEQIAKAVALSLQYRGQ